MYILFSWFVDFALLKRARLIINLPFTNFLAIHVRSFIPELTIIVVALPTINLFALVKSACLQRLSIFTPPFPIAVQFAVYILSKGFHNTILIIKLPFPMTLAILHLTFA